MIWFTCKQCGKTHGRSEGSAGTMIFCECGYGNLVPWESTAPTPQTTEEDSSSVPTLGPVKFDRKERPADRRGRRRPSRPLRPNPDFCLNHETVRSQMTCADCKEAFCSACVVELEGETLCGPCKNYRVRSWQQPPRVSGYALSSVILALAGVLGALLAGPSGPALWLFALLPQAAAMILGGLGLRAVERNAELGGRALALTGVLMAGLAIFLTVLFTFYSPGLLT